MGKIITFIFIFFLSLDAHAFMTAKYMVQACTAMIHDNSESEPTIDLALDFGLCVGMGESVLRAVPLIMEMRKQDGKTETLCLPDGITVSDISKVYVKYHIDNPEFMELPAFTQYIMALGREYPCK
ncbi:MAG: Rap1a/Tai family immunity protein [Alphaproteobacteria bacterium]|nr:Rap1a/Tai family immunity protein [Alphaproteobacteria bacterium]